MTVHHISFLTSVYVLTIYGNHFDAVVNVNYLCFFNDYEFAFSVLKLTETGSLHGFSCIWFGLLIQLTFHGKKICEVLNRMLISGQFLILANDQLCQCGSWPLL